MSFALLLCSVLLAVFALASLLLSIFVALIWGMFLNQTLATSGQILALRLLPVGGALLLVLTVALPAFLLYEPSRELEEVGPVILSLALFSLAAFGHGIWRGWRACSAARLLAQRSRRTDRCTGANGLEVEILDVAEPLVAVVGAWHPRIVAASCVIAGCSQEELRQVIAHEAAHVAARDNLKLLLLIASPDALAWLPLGSSLAQRWRTAAEFEADERATGADPRKRVALAGALIKVARLAAPNEPALPALSMPIAADDVAGRVRQLLAAPQPRQTGKLGVLASCALLTPVVALPLYALVHQFIEALVSFGR